MISNINMMAMETRCRKLDFSRLYPVDKQNRLRYGYGAVGQLIREEISGKTVGYGYDLAGNRIWKEGTTGKEDYTYNQKNQLVQRRSQEQLLTYQYDPQGNLIQETGSGVSYYSYDPFNRQSKVVKPDKQVQENRYDPEGLRAEMLENGKLARFVFHRGEIAAELDEQDQLVGFYQRGHGVEGILQDQEHTCVLKDERQSTIFILNQAHEIKNQYQYDAFGVMEEKNELIANRILYTGQQYDGVAEQYYLRARYYNPVVGRFLQEDVYRGDGLNLYAYCGNNPVAYYDPSGYAKDPAKYGSGGIIEGPEKVSQYSGNLFKVDSPDAAADALAERIGGQSRVRFENDPKAREFDVVSDNYIAQAKPDLKGYGKSWRNQTKATFEAASETGRTPYFQFEGDPSPDVIRKIQEYSERYGIDYVIDTTPLGVEN